MSGYDFPTLRRRSVETTGLRHMLEQIRFQAPEGRRGQTLSLPPDIVDNLARQIAAYYKPAPLQFVGGTVSGRRRSLPPPDYFSGPGGSQEDLT